MARRKTANVVLRTHRDETLSGILMIIYPSASSWGKSPQRSLQQGEKSARQCLGSRRVEADQKKQPRRPNDYAHPAKFSRAIPRDYGRAKGTDYAGLVSQSFVLLRCVHSRLHTPLGSSLSLCRGLWMWPLTIRPASHHGTRTRAAARRGVFGAARMLGNGGYWRTPARTLTYA